MIRHAGSSLSASSARPNDERVLVDEVSGLYAVADAHGPTYGGYHRPVGLAPGWEALVETWRSTIDSPVMRMERAMAHANAAMLAAGDGLDERNRKAIEAGGNDLAHSAASMSVLGIVGDLAVFAQVGNTLGWVVRDGRAEVLVPCHTLGAELAQGESLPVEMRRLPARCLGLAPAWNGAVRSFDLREGDVLALCSIGVWSSIDDAAVVRALTSVRDPADGVAALLGLVADDVARSALVLTRRAA